MSGHSKWSSIKHKKAATDAKRGKMFTKLARAITVAARDGGGDPEGNPALATAIQKARDASMPKDNIQRAIDRGTGSGRRRGRDRDVVFEGYGPGGAAILVEALTDNRNRTSADVRFAFNKHNGSLGEPGSVAWIFEKRGVIAVDGGRYTEDDLMPAIDAGAEDVRDEGDLLRVLCEPADLATVREALESAGVEVESAEVAMEPKNTVEVKGNEAKSLLGLIETLEEHDDVDSVHANFDIPESVLEQLPQPASAAARIKASEAFPESDPMQVVIGVDPGAANLGFGFVRVEGNRMSALDAGVVETSADLPIERRLEHIHAELAKLIDWHEPTALAIEDSTSARTCARRWRSGRRAESRCSPPPSAASPAPPTRRRRSRWRSAAAGSAGKAAGPADGRHPARAAGAARLRPCRRRPRGRDLPRSRRRSPGGGRGGRPRG